MWRHRRAVLVLGVLGLMSVVLLTSCARGSSSQSRPSSGAAGASHRGTAAVAATTQVKTFLAYGPTGRLTVPVENVATGSCFTASVADPVPGAYRCFAAGNTLLDPCFAARDASHPTSLACVTSPWGSATVLTLTAQLPSADPGVTENPPSHPSPARPWAFALHNGARCVASTGTVPQVAGVNLNYTCADGTGAALVDPTGMSLVARYGNLSGHALQRVAVDTVWRG